MTAYGDIPIAGGDTATPLNRVKRLKLLERFLPAPPVRFLDCGCGEGAYVKLLRQELAVDAVGIEYLPEKVAAARRDPELEPFIQQGDIANIPFGDDHFDAVLLNEVLEHVPDEKRGLREIRRVLKPGGRLIIFSPNRWYPFEAHGVYLKGTEFKVPPSTPFVPYIPLPLGRCVFRYWARNYWHGELQTLCEECGFQTIARDFIWQTFENISGVQPAWIRVSRPVLRRLASLFETTPLVRRFGVSQALILKKPETLSQ